MCIEGWISILSGWLLIDLFYASRANKNATFRTYCENEKQIFTKYMYTLQPSQWYCSKISSKHTDFKYICSLRTDYKEFNYFHSKFCVRISYHIITVFMWFVLKSYWSRTPTGYSFQDKIYSFFIPIVDDLPSVRVKKLSKGSLFRNNLDAIATSFAWFYKRHCHSKVDCMINFNRRLSKMRSRVNKVK